MPIDYTPEDIILRTTMAGETSPDDLTGVAVTAGAGAANWGADTQLRAAAAAPFYIIGLTFEPDTAEKWEVRLSADGGTTYFWRGMVESTVNVANHINIPPISHTQGTAIHASVRSETGGNIIDLWLQVATY